MDRPPENDFCSICHNNFSIPCQANCSHWFCGRCILQVWDHGATLQPCKCPLCRREITLLIPNRASSIECNNSEAADVFERIGRYNRQFGQETNSLAQRLQDLPFLLRRLTRDLLNPQRSLPFVLKMRVYLAMLVSVIYIISPVDLIPEGFLGIIGLLDDAIIALVCFLHVAALYRSELVFRHPGGS